MSVAAAKASPPALPPGAAIGVPNDVVMSSIGAQSWNLGRDNSFTAPTAQLGDGTGMYAASAPTDMYAAPAPTVGTRMSAMSAKASPPASPQAGL